MVESSAGIREADLRARIEDLEHRRVDVADARISVYRSVPFRVLVDVGQAWVARLLLAILLSDIGLAVVARSFVIALIGVALLGAMAVYINVRIEGWVAEHNARIDAQIRALLDAAAPEPE